MPRLSTLARPRSFGFAGQEGELFDQANQNPNSLSSLITNESIRGMEPQQNYMQRSGGERVDLGPSGRDIRIQGLPAILDPNGENITVYAPSGKQYQTSLSEQQAIAEQQRQQAEMADIPRRMALAKLKEQEAKAQGGGLSPADQLAREKFEWEKSQGKPQDKVQVERVQTANDALDIINQAKQIFSQGKATQSLLGKGYDVAAGAFGASTEGARAAAQLKALGGALVSKMPKMSGPQSDKDVLLYREMAGQIADDTIPLETRAAALSTVEALQRKYAGMQDAPQTTQGGFEADKEARYQAWKAQQGR